MKLTTKRCKADCKHKKSLAVLQRTVRQFLAAIAYVPFRPLDCDVDHVEELLTKLEDL